MSRRIWILNHYAGNSHRNRGGRHYWFSKYLKRFGESPVVFCCNAVHNGTGLFFQDDSLWHERMAEEIQVPFVFVKGRPYVGNGLGRVLNMIDFYRNVKIAAKEYAKENGKPDIIFASSVHPLTLVAGIHLAKFFHVKCICEVRDLWPESFISYGMLKANNPVTFVLRQMEKWIYKEADALIFTMEGAYDYIKERGWEKDISEEKVHYINNGVDLEVFDYNRDNYTIADDDLDNNNLIKVVYTGSLLRGYNLKKLLDAMKIINNPKVKLLIWGKGDQLPYLKQYVVDNNIDNVEFKGFVEKKYIPYVLSKCDVAILNVTPTDILKYGGSQNKLFDYLASGIPIISGEDNRYSIIRNEFCGISKKYDSPKALAETLISVTNERFERKHIRSVAEQYDFKVLTRKLLDIIEK